MTDRPLSEKAALEILPSLAIGLEVIAARHLRADDVHDAVQETLARAVEAVKTGRRPSGASLAAYVHGIARHVIADVLRRRARDAPNPHNAGQLATVDPSPLEQLVTAEERGSIHRALARLTSADRELLRLCFVDGERIVDIAKRWGEPAERIRKRKSRALERLRELLAGSPGGHVSRRVPTSSRGDEERT